MRSSAPALLSRSLRAPSASVRPEHAEFPPIVVAVTNVCDMACIHCA
jgi:MoaA/NifB/PqqE/SkfB family radical SAM enzyme